MYDVYLFTTQFLPLFWKELGRNLEEGWKKVESEVSSGFRFQVSGFKSHRFHGWHGFPPDGV
jgi:hypothetical protein